MKTKYDVYWSGMDNGHEGMWKGPIWHQTFKILAENNGANFQDPESPIYKILEKAIPSVAWKSKDAKSATGYRLFFRDAREPWSSTGVINFSDLTKTISTTELGKRLARGEISPAEVFIRAMESHQEAGEKPFSVLAAAFLQQEGQDGLTFDQLSVGVMRNYRPDCDNLKDSLKNVSTKKLEGTPLRRFRHMLEMLEDVGAISSKDNEVYVAWNLEILERIAGEKDNNPTINMSELNYLINEFQDDCKKLHLSVTREIALRLTAALCAKRFLILTGLAGSGKTKLAQAFARWIAPSKLEGDIFFPGAEIYSSNVTYYVKNSDKNSVEFWNSPNEAEATKVTLPREMIQEWAAYILNNSIPQTTPARDIREGVKKLSKYSDQLHSFETHLKAAAFAQITSQADKRLEKCYTVLPVGADWTGNENIIGYPDGLQADKYISKPALELILHAEQHKHIPHFLILDEMNLSHVERYFADLLSIIESDEGLDLYPGSMTDLNTWKKTSAEMTIPPRLKQLPENLFIIGTVNVDETTYMFSPKVLDRANVIEFRMEYDDLEEFLVNAAKTDLRKIDGRGKKFGRAFVNAATGPASVSSDVKEAYDAKMLSLFKILQTHGVEFGYRTAYEAARFIHFYKVLGKYHDGDDTWLPNAFDCVIFQKILPKLHGSRAKLGPVLKKLWLFCVNNPSGGDAAAKQADEEPSENPPSDAPYPLSAKKIGRMWRLLIENGFSSFAEA